MSALRTLPPTAASAPPEPPLIDGWMPACDAAERHQTRVRAPAAEAWRALQELDFTRSPVIRALLALRSLPVALGGRRRERGAGGSLAALERNGFVRLDERPGRELLLGLVGRFWRPSGGVLRVTPEQLRAFDQPGYAVAVWSFTVVPRADGAILSTETRVRCTDDQSRRSFLRSWRVIGPFSGLTRTAMLRALKRAAEASLAARVP